MVTDDEQAGYLMLTGLLRLHGPVAAGQSIELLAFSGTKTAPAAQLREQGLRRAWSSTSRCACVIWSMAMQAFQQSGRVPGKDVLFSAVNSSPAILQARLDGRLSTLVAGHFTLGGWAMVLINDDAKGVNIDAHGGRDCQEALFQLIDATQAQRLLGPLAPVDFRALSAVGKPASYRYPFSLQLLLR
ncbi:hypothetical protein SAMN03159485_04918 [Pseudomonas sp. NFPP24]|nr:hypothetical protein SAMN03159485_04918 [Pseudomonas sp. NFPP24]